MPTNLIGMEHGQLRVISRHSSIKKAVRWNVVCLLCSKQYVARTDTIKKNTFGCSECARLNAPKGNASIYWRGGKYISAIFLSNVVRGARKRNIDCDISIDDLDNLWEKQQGRCAYTNRKLSIATDGCTASLDRIDSSKGYYIGNVQYLHKDVNVSKWAMKEETFFQMVKEICQFKELNDDTAFFQK